MHAHLILLLIAWVWSAAAGATTSTTSSSRSKLTKPGTTIHTAFPTECGLYFVWQSIGMVYSHKKIRQPGPLTRIVSCTPEEWEAMSPESRDFVQTHVAPNYAIHPRTGDKYPAYNKPMAVIDWLAKTNVKEDYVLIIDADMIMRRPILPDPSSPLATSAFFGYMIGVDNELAMKHVPEVTPRDDELAGPKGRRGDKAGGFTMMQTDQLRKVAPLWLQYTEDVRADPDAWRLTGDQYATKPGDKPWISEMYGYSFACAKADVWHKTPLGMMLYPGYEVRTPPSVLHYGLRWSVGLNFEFDKHWHYDFDPFLCPPWNLDAVTPNEQGNRAIQGGLFPHPPAPSSFSTTGLELLRDLLAVEPVIILNAALCQRHVAKCSPSDELERQCAKARALEAELDARMAELLPRLPEPCQNMHQKCEQWAMSGECRKNPNYMLQTCVKACGFCLGGSDESNNSDARTVIEADGHAIDREQVAGRGSTSTKVGASGDRQDSVDDPLVHMEAEDDGEDVFEDLNPQDSPSLRLNVDETEVARLLLRCKKNAPTWTASDVKECVELARDGIEFHASTKTSSEASRDAERGDSDTIATITTPPATPTTNKKQAIAEEEPMSLASIISSNLTLKEKLLLGACGSYLTWFVASRRRSRTSARMSRYRKQHREKNDRLPTRGA